MKRVPKDIIDEFNKNLYTDDLKNISVDSAIKTKNWIMTQPIPYRRTLLMGLVLEARKYIKAEKLEKKKKKLLGD